MSDRLLVVSATLLEVAPSLLRETGVAYEGVGLPGSLIEGSTCDFLITGVGQLLCGVHLTRALATGRYTQVLQVGIGGSFEPSLGRGAVAVVVEEALADLGAEDNGAFLDIFHMGLLKRDEMPFSDGVLSAPVIELLTLKDLPRVRSVTVNRVLSEERSIAWVRSQYRPQVVNMEGAALFYSCLLVGISFVSLRAISDMVGPRDKSSWDIPGAVGALDRVVEPLVNELTAGFGGGVSRSVGASIQQDPLVSGSR